MIVAVVGCATTPIVPVGQARTDAASGTIELPLDSTSFTSAELREFTQVQSRLVDRCLVAHGQPAGPVDDFQPTTGDDRRFGVWTMAVARQYGYGMRPAGVARAAWQATQDPTWRAANVACLDSTAGQQGDTLAKLNGVLRGSARLAEEAHAAAAADPRYRQFRAPWIACLGAHGVAFVGDDADSLPDVPADSEAGLRQAVIDVQCKLDANMVPQLAALEATYQVTVMQREQVLVAQLQQDKAHVMADVRRRLANG